MEDSNDRLALRCSEVATSLGVSERFIWDLVKRDEIPHLRIGRRVVFPTRAVSDWMDKQLELQS